MPRGKRKTGGREDSHRPIGQSRSSPSIFDGFSSSELDAIDLTILSLAEDRPMTALSIAERADIPFVQCLKRARRLQAMGFLERTENTSDDVGLYWYLSSKKHL